MVAVPISRFKPDPARHPAGVTLIVINGKLERTDQNGVAEILPSKSPSGSGTAGELVFDPGTGQVFVSDGQHWQTIGRGTLGDEYARTTSTAPNQTQNSYLYIDSWATVQTDESNGRYTFKTVSGHNDIGIAAPGTGSVFFVLARMRTKRDDTNYSTLDRRFRFTPGGLGNWFEEYHMTSSTNGQVQYPASGTDYFDSALLLPWVSLDFQTEYSTDEPSTVQDLDLDIWAAGNT